VIRGRLAPATLLGALSLAMIGCGGDDPGSGAGDRPTVVATTGLIADVVTEATGGAVEVATLVPDGADVHTFAPSARQVAELTEADLVVAAGLGLEEGLTDPLDTAAEAGTTVLLLGDELDVGGDPHWFSDPVQMQAAVALVAVAVDEVVGGDEAVAARAAADDYQRELADLDEQIRARLAVVAPEDRTIVTNHDGLEAFAARYDLTVLDTVLPGTSSLAGTSPSDLAALADRVVETGTRAIFIDARSPADLADALADETAGRVTVVELHSETLGGPGSGAETYTAMLDTDARRIAAALG
jgi:zinc/manganese transport system substrate-binding protein